MRGESHGGVAQTIGNVREPPSLLMATHLPFARRDRCDQNCRDLGDADELASVANTDFSDVRCAGLGFFLDRSTIVVEGRELLFAATCTGICYAYKPSAASTMAENNFDAPC
jgi:hypothetical protein